LYRVQNGTALGCITRCRGKAAQALTDFKPTGTDDDRTVPIAELRRAISEARFATFLAVAKVRDARRERSTSGIAHHEHVLRRNLRDDLDRIESELDQLSPATADWVRCRSDARAVIGHRRSSDQQSLLEVGGFSQASARSFRTCHHTISLARNYVPESVRRRVIFGQSIADSATVAAKVTQLQKVYQAVYQRVYHAGRCSS
jgi:hypothetical protein